MKKKSTLFLFLSLFIGGVVWGALPNDAFKWARSPSVSQQSPTELDQRIERELGTFARLAEELKPSVVNISTVKKLPDQDGAVPHFPQTSGQGSGVIISSDGDVLTNNHVVEGGKTISVKLSDGREFEADVVGIDPTTDLALLKIRSAPELPVAQLGDSDALAVGDWVMAIGNPFGLEATVTVGVLSGKGRVIGAGPYDDFLQTDASINPGNSGGPLFSTRGEVIGINTAIVQGGQGIGFSIPINLAREVTAELQDHGRVVRGFIGAGIQGLTPALKSALSLPEDTAGALVSSIVAGSPADEAGLKTSDVIVAIDNERIRHDRDLLMKVAKLQIGKEFPFTVRRDGVEETVFVTIAERPSYQEPPEELSDEEPSSNARVGVAVTDLQGLNGTSVVITAVVPGSPAHRAELRPGDVIRGVADKPVSTAHQFVREVAKVKGDLALLIERQGQTTFVVVEE